MAETPVFESPVVKDYPADPGADLTLSDASDTAKPLVRADAAAAIGFEVGFGAAQTTGDVLVCGLRPGEWGVWGTADAAATYVAGLDQSGHVSVVDHTHSRCLFRLTGIRAAGLLEKVCSLDWSDDFTPDGAVVSASVAKVGCDLVRNDQTRDGAMTPSYLISCDRSFGQYLFDALLDAGDEFGIAVA